MSKQKRPGGRSLFSAGFKLPPYKMPELRRLPAPGSGERRSQRPPSDLEGADAPGAWDGDRGPVGLPRSLALPLGALGDTSSPRGSPRPRAAPRPPPPQTWKLRRVPGLSAGVAPVASRACLGGLPPPSGSHRRGDGEQRAAGKLANSCGGLSRPAGPGPPAGSRQGSVWDRGARGWGASGGGVEKPPWTVGQFPFFRLPGRPCQVNLSSD